MSTEMDEIWREAGRRSLRLRELSDSGCTPCPNCHASGYFNGDGTPGTAHAEGEQLHALYQHLSGAHDGPENYRTECAGCDNYRLTVELEHARRQLAEAEENQRELTKDWARTVREMQAEINELTRAQT